MNKDGISYVLKPQMQYFTDLDCALPVGNQGSVHLIWDGEYLEVISDVDGGVLELGKERIPQIKGKVRRSKI